MLDVGIIFRHSTNTTRNTDNFAPDLWIAYAAREPKIKAITVLTTATVRLLTKNCAVSIRSNSPTKFSTEKAFGKNFGGTATTSEPALKEQHTT